jgi:hypothetical protein
LRNGRQADLQEMSPTQHRQLPGRAQKAWRNGRLDRWPTICPSCVVAEADRADGYCFFQGELVDALNLRMRRDQSLKA